MSSQARITSIDALESMRGELLAFIGRARAALDDISGETRRTRSWLENDCLRHWQQQLKFRQKHLDAAEQELFSVNLTAPEASHAARKMAVMRARRQVAEAGEKLHRVKQWRLQFDNRVEPLLGQLNPLGEQIRHHLPKGVHLLTESIKALQDYAGTSTPSHPAPDSAATGQDPSDRNKTVPVLRISPTPPP